MTRAPASDAEGAKGEPYVTLDAPGDPPELPLRAAVIWLEILLTHATTAQPRAAGALPTVELPQDDHPSRPTGVQVHAAGPDWKEPLP